MGRSFRTESFVTDRDQFEVSRKNPASKGASIPEGPCELCLLNPCNVCCTVGHITVCYSRHDSDILLTLRRLGPKSDIVKTARIIHSAQRTFAPV